MNSVSYKSLYEQVVATIEAQTTYSQGLKTSDQLKRQAIAPLSGNALSDVTSAAIVNSIQTLLSDIIKPRIISGLFVKATNPSSGSVIVEAGRGVSYGRYYELRADTTVTIPFDNKTEIFYIVLFENAIMIDKSYDFRKLVLAKIIVPKPGTTSFIIDNKDENNLYDAYIINQKEYYLHGDKYGNFEEDTIELLRENINPILADNLIGNIRLTEDLKITNTAGTLELDSKEMRLKDTNNTTSMRLNRNGTFFYDENGREIARFSTDSARVGNIVILKDGIQSGNFVSGALGSGFQIKDSGDAEFNNIRARGKFTTSVFEKETISSIGGNLLVADSDVLAEDMTASNDSTLKISGDTTFEVGDILRIKDGVDDEWFEVTDVDSASNTYTVTRDKAGVYTSNNNPVWKKGTAVINYGSSTDGMIYMTASESNAPYMSVINTGTTPWIAPTTRLRIGNLNGFLGYTEDAYGTAIGDEDNYLKYDPVNGLRIKGNVIITGGTSVSGINTFYQSATASGEGVPTSLAEGDLWFNTDDNRWYRAESVGADEITAGEWVLSLTGLGSTPSINSGLYLSSDYLGYFDGDEWTSYIKNDGTFYFGGADYSGSASNYLCWNGYCLKVRGELVADDIKTGTLRLCYMCLLDPLDSNNYSYLSSGEWHSHTECGVYPYVKRICSGVACTGTTVRLKGYTEPPEVIVSIKSLMSYNSDYPTQGQMWSVYHDNMAPYDDSVDGYGYEFDVHAILSLSDGSGTEVVKNVAFGVSTCTAPCVCSTLVKNNFLYYCNAAAPGNYYYGVVDYQVCYRKVGDGTWCCCCFQYTQPHTNSLQVITQTSQCITMSFPCLAQWELLANETNVTWCDSGFISGCQVQNCCLWCSTISCSAWTSYMCYTACCVLNNAFASAPTCDANIFLSCISFNVNNLYIYTVPPQQGAPWCQVFRDNCCSSWYNCYKDQTVHTGSADGFYCCICLNNCNISYYTGCKYKSTLGLLLFACSNRSTGGRIEAGCITSICQIICYYSYSYVGNAFCCKSCCLCSLLDTYGCYCIIDPNGQLNWMAISY